jgi:hypothetical protein
VGFNVTANELNKFANYVYDQVRDDLATTHDGIMDQALSIEGLGGVLVDAGLTDFMQNSLGALIADDVTGPLHDKLWNMAFTVKAACKAYGKIDQKAEEQFVGYQGQIILPGGPNVAERADELDNRTYANYKNESEVIQPDVDVPDDWVAEAISELGWADEAINWVYEQIRGKSLVEEIIDPINGGFPRLKANADAWRDSGKNFAKIADNLQYNARILTRQHWDGEASDAFMSGIGGYWAGLNGVAAVCFVVAKGFEALYTVCLKAAKHIVSKILPQILSLLRRIASKFIPLVGQAWELIESLIEWEVPYAKYVDMIHDAVEQVIGMIQAIEDVVQTFNAYKGVIESAGSIVEQMADMNPDGVGPSGADVVAMGKTMKQAADHVTEITGKPEKDKKTGEYKRDEDNNVILKGGSKTHRGLVREATEAAGKIRQRVDAEIDKRRKGK